MLSGAVARRYAKALIELASDGKARDRIEEELKGVRKIFRNNPQLKHIVLHPTIVRAEKRKLIENIFGEHVSETTLNFLRLIIERRRENYLEGMVDEYVRLANEARNLVQAEVTTAVKLSESETNRLKKRLAGLTGKTVNVKTKVNPRLLGGAIVKIGDQIIDGSIAGKLEKLATSLSQAR